MIKRILESIIFLGVGFFFWFILLVTFDTGATRNYAFIIGSALTVLTYPWCYKKVKEKVFWIIRG